MATGWAWSGLGGAFYHGFELKEGWLGLVLGWGPSSKPKEVSVPSLILANVGSVWLWELIRCNYHP